MNERRTPSANSCDAMVKILGQLEAAEAVNASMTFRDDDEAIDAHRAQTIVPIREAIAAGKATITSDEGARLALYTALTLGTFIDPFTHALVYRTLAYLDERAA